MMASASALDPNCGYKRLLGRKRVRTAAQQTSMDRGTVFHRAVEEWIATGDLPQLEDLEIQGWVDLLASQWEPPPGVAVELAWGLSPDGAHVMVEEPEPHVYRAMDGSQLLTAGRADAAWMEVDLLRVVDWKTGRYPVTPAEWNLQANAAGLALGWRRRARGYVPGIYYARDGFFDWGSPVLFDSPDYLGSLAAVKHAAQLDETPRPGEWCGGCWERKACPAAQP